MRNEGFEAMMFQWQEDCWVAPVSLHLSMYGALRTVVKPHEFKRSRIASLHTCKLPMCCRNPENGFDLLRETPCCKLTWLLDFLGRITENRTNPRPSASLTASSPNAKTENLDLRFPSEKNKRMTPQQRQRQNSTSKFRVIAVLIKAHSA